MTLATKGNFPNGPLGTKAGPIIPSGGLIAGDVPKYAKVSEYAKYYGTFSGADIKVVVHYPKDYELEQALQALKDEIEAEIAKEEAWFWANRDSLDTQGLADAIQRRDVLSAESKDMSLEIARLKDLPTTQTLGEIQSISWGSYRELGPFRPLGSTYPRSFVKGPRSIAGSMVFTIFHEHVFHELMNVGLRYHHMGTSDYDRYLNTTMLVDQLPPLDISLICANEYGAISHMGLWGVQFFQEGGVFSIEDIFSESQVQYVARDFDPLRIVETRYVDGHGVTEEWNTTASDMLRKQQLTAHLRRRNPFL